MYVCMCVCMCVCVCMYVCVVVCIYVCMYVCMYSMYVCMYICMYLKQIEVSVSYSSVEPIYCLVLSLKLKVWYDYRFHHNYEIYAQ